MINLQIRKPIKLPIEKSILIHAAQVALNSEKAPEKSEISLVVGDDALLKKLNGKYRHISAPTDVLSFPSKETDPDTENTYLGDIIISLPRAQEQAAAAGHSLDVEMQLLVVHGVLHLLGYDHSEVEDKSKMQSAQDEILDKLGVHLDIIL